MKPSEILRAARARIVAGWCKGAQAENVFGRPAFAASPEACRYCMAGAIVAEAGIGYPMQPEFYRAFDYLRAEIDGTIPEFNDRQATRWPVVAAYNRAIARAEQDERETEAA